MWKKKFRERRQSYERILVNFNTPQETIEVVWIDLKHLALSKLGYSIISEEGNGVKETKIFRRRLIKFSNSQKRMASIAETRELALQYTCKHIFTQQFTPRYALQRETKEVTLSVWNGPSWLWLNHTNTSYHPYRSVALLHFFAHHEHRFFMPQTFDESVQCSQLTAISLSAITEPSSREWGEGGGWEEEEQSHQKIPTSLGICCSHLPTLKGPHENPFLELCIPPA